MAHFSPRHCWPALTQERRGNIRASWPTFNCEARQIKPRSKSGLVGRAEIPMWFSGKQEGAKMPLNSCLHLCKGEKWQFLLECPPGVTVLWHGRPAVRKDKDRLHYIQSDSTEAFIWHYWISISGFVNINAASLLCANCHFYSPKFSLMHLKCVSVGSLNMFITAGMQEQNDEPSSTFTLSMCTRKMGTDRFIQCPWWVNYIFFQREKQTNTVTLD